jgi:hypothetical protein
MKFRIKKDILGLAPIWVFSESTDAEALYTFLISFDPGVEKLSNDHKAFNPQ